MPDEVTTTELYKVNMTEFEGVPAADDLIGDAAGTYYVGNVKIITAGNYERGELLMSNATGEFIPVTKAGIATAKELAISCVSVNLPSDSYSEIPAYFSGLFKGERIILPYETIESEHSEELEEIRAIMRQHQIYIA